jgi:hypothetical protein
MGHRLRREQRDNGSNFGFQTVYMKAISTAHTRGNETTIGCMRGTAFQSTDEGTLGRRLPCQRYSTNDRIRRTICLPSVATNCTAGSGLRGRMCLGLAQCRGGEESCECQLWDSYFLTVPRRTLVRDVLSDARSRTHRKLHQMPSKNPATIAEHRLSMKK